MSFFKKAGKAISSTFKKAPSVASSIFKKGETIANKVGSGLDKVGAVLGKVADVGGSILSNPLTQAAASGIGSAFGVPDAGMYLGQAAEGLKTVKKLSDYAKKGANISRSAGGVSGALSRGDIQGTIQKAKDMSGGVQEPMFV